MPPAYPTADVEQKELYRYITVGREYKCPQPSLLLSFLKKEQLLCQNLNMKDNTLNTNRTLHHVVYYQKTGVPYPFPKKMAVR